MKHSIIIIHISSTWNNLGWDINGNFWKTGGIMYLTEEQLELLAKNLKEKENIARYLILGEQADSEDIWVYTTTETEKNEAKETLSEKGYGVDVYDVFEDELYSDSLMVLYQYYVEGAHNRKKLASIVLAMIPKEHKIK